MKVDGYIFLMEDGTRESIAGKDKEAFEDYLHLIAGTTITYATPKALEDVYRMWQRKQKCLADKYYDDEFFTYENGNIYDKDTGEIVNTYN